MDSLFFNVDGTIRKVIPTLRGVGITDARTRIQIDRYSSISSAGISIAFLDESEPFKGWKAIFGKKNAWLQYNKVDLGMKSAGTGGAYLLFVRWRIASTYWEEW